MVRILGIDVPQGLEDLWARIFQFDNNTTPEKLILKTSTPTRSSRSYLAGLSYFVQYQYIYMGLSQTIRDAWTAYWGMLPFSSHGGANMYPGSGYSAFIYVNTPRIKQHLSLLLIPPNPFELFRSNTSKVILYRFGYAYNTEFYGQSFIQNKNTNLSKITIPFQKYGNPTDDITLSVYDDNSGVPGNWLYDSITTINGTSLSTTNDIDCDFLFSGNANMTPNAKYWIVLKRTTSLDTSNYYRIWVSTAYPGADFVFKLWQTSNAWYLTGVYWQICFKAYRGGT
jgi:hypothetical protein